MAEVYTRRATLALKKETVTGTPVVPNVFLRFNEESISQDFAYAPVNPVAGNRSLNLGSIPSIIPAPDGKIELYVEPLTIGHILQGIFGLTSGIYMPLSSKSGAFTVGETVGNGVYTAVVVADGKDFLLISTPSGVFSAGDTITGVSSSKTGTLVVYSATNYGHVGSMPAELASTYTVQLNYTESAIRYYGVRFYGLDTLGQSDNVVSMGVKMIAQAGFRHAKVTAITTAGATKTITVDSTAGIIATDVIKIYRPSTGAFIDLNGTGVKTEAITSITDSENLVLATLTDATAVGDLLMLAPQTASYTVADEIPFIGGSTIQLGATLAGLSTHYVEEFNLTVENEMEARYSASGNAFSNRYPTTILQKGAKASGNFMRYYRDEKIMSYLRDNTSLALRYKAQGGHIGATSQHYELRFDVPEFICDTYNTPITGDELVNEDVPFTAIYNTADAKLLTCLLVNSVASY